MKLKPETTYMLEKPDGSVTLVRVLRDEGEGWYEVESEWSRYSVNINQIVTIKEVPKEPGNLEQ